MFRDDLDLILWLSKCQREAYAIALAKHAAGNGGALWQ